MGVKVTPDFSGYATRAGVKCADGRTITPQAFQDQDGARVPLVWQHGHDSPENVLGHSILESRDDGMYCHNFFNSNSAAQTARALVQHKDITHMSIHANQLVEKSKSVLHGVIREVSLVLSGANPGALIDYVTVVHSDDSVEKLDDEAVIYTDDEIVHDDGDDEEDEGDEEDVPGNVDKNGDVSHADDGPSVMDVYNGMDADQQAVVKYFVGVALEEGDGAAAHSDDSDDDSLKHAKEGKEGTTVKRNVFADNDTKKGKSGTDDESHVLTHDAMRGIAQRAVKLGSLKGAFEEYAEEHLEHGIDDIETLFPTARTTDAPEFDQRRVVWVAKVLDAIKKSPFSRIKSRVADITQDEARAKGYIKGTLKKEEWFGLVSRTTAPTTVYKKQKLDRDDIIDITDFDVVVWMKAEMRVMLDEELARAALIGDGRDVDDADKIKDPMGEKDGIGIRSIANDHDLYAVKLNVDDGLSSIDQVDTITRAMAMYKGSGSPTLYTTLARVSGWLTTRDEFGHRQWPTRAELASEMGVAEIVDVEVMETETDLLGIIVNLRDYSFGTDQGGEITFFDFFDIDYNQNKYLYETRLSGALTKIRSALVLTVVGSSDTHLVNPTAPTYNSDTGVVTIPTMAHVTYKNADTGSTVTGTVTIDEGDTLEVIAVPGAGYYFDDNQHNDWKFRNRTTT